ncbi:PAS domain-containing protein, partial [Lacticaseibacillus rhamnosus]
LGGQSLDNARAYAAADEGHRRLAATFQSMVEAVFLYDAQGRVIDLNEPVLHLLRLSSREEALRPAADSPTLLELQALGDVALHRHPSDDPAPIIAEEVRELLQCDVAVYDEWCASRGLSRMAGNVFSGKREILGLDVDL